MAFILRNLYRFHRYINPEDTTSFREFRQAGKYAAYTGGALGSGSLFQSQVIGTNRLRHPKTLGLANWFANRLRGGITGRIPQRLRKSIMPKRKYNAGVFKFNTSNKRRKFARRRKWKKKQKYALKGGLQGTLTRYQPFAQRKVGWSKGPRSQMAKAAKMLRYISDCTGKICTFYNANHISLNDPAIAADEVRWGCLHLLTGYGVTGANGADICKMFCIAQNIDPTTVGRWTGILHDKKNLYLDKIHIQFSIGEVETGTVDANWDMYECVCRKDSAIGDIGDDGIDWLDATVARATRPTTHGGTALDKKFVGMTPWSGQEFGSKFKIVKYREGQCNGTDTQSFHLQYNYGKMINPDRLFTNSWLAGLSRVFLFRNKGSLGNGTTFQASTLTVKYIIKYTFTMAGVSVPYVCTSSATVV